jgi:hypothetical protein
MPLVRTYSEKEQQFFRRLVLPVEDLDPEARWARWRGRGMRWFRSPNVLCIEHYRRPPAAPIQRTKPAA